MSDKDNKEISIKKIPSTLPTAFADQIHIAVRADDMVLVQFFTDLPGVLAEDFRVMLKTDTAKNMLEGLATALNHYPEKKTEQKAPAKRRTIKPKK